MLDMSAAASVLLVFSALTAGACALTQGADTVRLCPKAQQGRSYVFECSGATGSDDRFIYWEGSRNNKSFSIGRCYFEDIVCKADDPMKFNITNLSAAREFKSLLTFHNVSESDRDLIINCSVWDMDSSDDKEVVDACRLTLFNPREKSVILGKPESEFDCASPAMISYQIDCSASMFTTNPDVSLYVGGVMQRVSSSMSRTEQHGGLMYYWRTSRFNLTLNESAQGVAIRCEAKDNLPNSTSISDQLEIHLPQFMRRPYFTNSSGIPQELVMTLDKGQNETVECHSPVSTIFITCDGAQVDPVTRAFTKSDSASLLLQGDKIKDSVICYCRASYRGRCANATTALIISSPGPGIGKKFLHFSKWTPLFYIFTAVISIIFLIIVLGAAVFVYRHWKLLRYTLFERPENSYEYINPKPDKEYGYQNIPMEENGGPNQRFSSVSSDPGVFHANFPAPPISLRQPNIPWESGRGTDEDSGPRCVSFHQNDPAPSPCGLSVTKHSGGENENGTRSGDDLAYVDPVDPYESHIPVELPCGTDDEDPDDQCPTNGSPRNDLSIGPDPSRDNELTYTNCFSDASNEYKLNPDLENFYIEPSSRVSSVDELNRAQEEYLINLLKLDA